VGEVEVVVPLHGVLQMSWHHPRHVALTNDNYITLESKDFSSH